MDPELIEIVKACIYQHGFQTFDDGDVDYGDVDELAIIIIEKIRKYDSTAGKEKPHD